jgi:hypothetical protein
MNVKRLGIGLMLGLAVMLCGAGKAEAASPMYACNVQFIPPQPVPHYSLGNYGYISVNFYSAPNCGGTYLSFGYICSQGADSSYCPSNYQFTDHGIGALFQALHSAAANGERLWVNNANGTVYYINFASNW